MSSRHQNPSQSSLRRHTNGSVVFLCTISYRARQVSDALLGGVGVVSVGVTEATVGGRLTEALVQLVRSRMMV